jgi:hypothetical protein
MLNKGWFIRRGVVKKGSECFKYRRKGEGSDGERRDDPLLIAVVKSREFKG